MSDVISLRSRRITMRDDSLPHQIRLAYSSADDKQHKIAVSCTCLAVGNGVAGPGYRAIEARSRWDDPGEPLRIWAQHVAEVTP